MGDSSSPPTELWENQRLATFIASGSGRWGERKRNGHLVKQIFTNNNVWAEVARKTTQGTSTKSKGSLCFGFLSKWKLN